MDTSAGGGQLRIGASDTICRYFLVPYLEKIPQSIPGSSYQGNQRYLYQMRGIIRKRTGRSDCRKLPKCISWQFVFCKHNQIFHDVFIANQSFRELKGKKLSYRQLLEYPILMLDKKSTTSEFLHSLFQQHQLDLVPEIELSSNDLLIDLARIGLGLAFIPDYCIDHEDEDLFIIDLKESFLPENWHSPTTSTFRYPEHCRNF